MAVYSYKGIDQKGKIHKGRQEAANVLDLEMRLGRFNLDLVNYHELKTKINHTIGRNVRRRDLVLFCFHMEQTLKAGIPLLESIGDLRDSGEASRLSGVLLGMTGSIEEGKTLSQAMLSFPNVFDKVFVKLVYSGERSGNLDVVFRDLSETLKWQDELSAQMQKLLIYPVMVGTIVFGVIAFMMMYVVPELLKTVQYFGNELPFHTQVLVFVSGIFIKYWYIVFPLPFIIFFAIQIAVKINPRFCIVYDKLKLKFPIIGMISKKIILSRIASLFSLMYASGITIVECIQVTGDVADNKYIEEVMRQVGQHIEDGKTLSHSFKSVTLFPSLVVRMVQVGENTGTLHSALRNVNYFYTRDVKESIEKLQAIMVPTITLLLGLIVLWVMFSVLMPIYDLITTIKL